jgi:ABC-type bacteriocin/lantibiotic exporter with double-glycine peptidase domain
MPGYRKLPHFRQSDASRNCGAACLAMLYQFYRKKGSISEITDAVTGTTSSGMPTCMLNLMIQDAWKKGFQCCGVSTKDLRTFIPTCLALGLEVIIAYHPVEGKPDSHFVVVSCCDDENVYVNDPSKTVAEGVNVPMSFDFLVARMKADTRREHIIVDNMMILLSPPHARQEVVEIDYKSNTEALKIPIFKEIYTQVEAISDPYHALWLGLEFEKIHAPT